MNNKDEEEQKYIPIYFLNHRYHHLPPCHSLCTCYVKIYVMFIMHVDSHVPNEKTGNLYVSIWK